MLIFIHLILYIFICSLQSITKNVYGVEASSNNTFSLKQLEFNNENEQLLTISRNKRFYPLDGGGGEGGGDGASPVAGAAYSCVPCKKGLCQLNGCKCVICPRPRSRNRRRRPQNKRPYYRRPRPRPYKRRRPYWWLRRYVVIEY
ncbi:unnamed protein product [Meloidogyne enterolobii]|uniref:Uncharacterized protein n=1 Tax=Meloidogyne enterolobii TaxID=390850 RepID=A0ACB0YGA1_MELEN